ncbi:MAG TPA: transcriptional regulator, partial [Alphaproteobacteria bacterium]|nr:transcriptional regulator [Alphaproteobacteria bacterium]
MLSRPLHHPDEADLVGYANGSTTGASALFIATHLAYCPACRGAVATAEAVAGTLMDEEALAGGSDGSALPDVTGVLQEQVGATTSAQRAGAAWSVPEPLRSAVGIAPAAVPWQNIWFGVKEYPIPGFEPAARLLWIPASRRMPRHDHDGVEWTMVVTGDFSDSTGRYGVGDVQIGVPGLN